jgi:ABC-type thiamin/hydroxymethylpyrimidine transport system permease subunit
MSWRHLVLTLAVMLLGMVLGIHGINEPRLIYFSNLVDRPRDESWAGFLIGGLAALAYLRVFQARLAGVPLRFATVGAIGGAIGFGGGSLLLALQYHVAPSWRWLPYWKFMEFTFGLLFGAALGWCALRLRERLTELATAEPETHSLASGLDTGQSDFRLWLIRALVGVLVVWGVFRGWPAVERELFAAVGEGSLGGWTETLLRVLPGFAGMGCVLMLMARRWPGVAWQTAISVTIVAAAIDWQRDLLPRGNIDWPAAYRVAFVLVVAAISILFVSVWQSGKRPRLMDLFLFAASLLMAIGYMMGLAESEIWWRDAEAESAAGGRAAYLWQAFRGELVVHAIFTALFAISLWAGWRERDGFPTTALNPNDGRDY